MDDRVFLSVGRQLGDDDTLCALGDEADLKEMLGPAFNGRYMSVDKPIEEAPILDVGECEVEPYRASVGILSRRSKDCYYYEAAA